MLSGKVSKDPDFEVARERNARTNIDGMAIDAEYACVSVAYRLPKQIGKHTAEILPGQPPLTRNYRLIARIKRPRNKEVTRKWTMAENEGRTAAAVAEEWRARRGNGTASNSHRWNLAGDREGSDDEEEEEELVTELVSDFAGFLFPIFPKEKEDPAVVPINGNWGEEEIEEESNDMAHLLISSGASASAGQEQSHYWGEEIVVKAESEASEYDSDDDSGDQKKKKPLFKIKKAKTVFKSGPSIKQEPQD